MVVSFDLEIYPQNNKNCGHFYFRKIQENQRGGNKVNGFTYKGKSTESILSSSALILVSLSQLDSVTGSSRESVVGNSSLTRQFPNEYGTMSDKLTFEYALIKKNEEPFTDEEQVTIESWLSSPKFSSELKVIDCDGTEAAIYYGKFTNTEWHTCAGGWSAVVFTFENKYAYPYKHFTHTFNISGSQTISFNCQSDELEEYVYPIITITATEETEQVTIVNKTDDDNTLTLRALDSLPITMDCNLCMLTDETTNGVVDFKDVGWNDVGNIYWPRLVSGINTLSITGTIQLVISYDAPYKKVGGWLW